jgi:hypothetical protein
MSKNTKTSDVTTASLEELHAILAKQNKVIATAEAVVDGVTAELRNRYATRLADALTEQGKVHGQHSFDADGFKLTGEVKATVKWNSDALRGIAQTLPHDQVNRLFKIEFSIPEKNYATITDDKLLARIVEARTVKYSEPKFKFAE